MVRRTFLALVQFVVCVSNLFDKLFLPRIVRHKPNFKQFSCSIQLVDVTCGQFAAGRFVYFRNPGYPQTFDSTRMCRARIGKLDNNICQLRLDMLRFDVARPTNGNCSSDVFVVTGQNENYVMPKICGFNEGQHCKYDYN